MVLQILSFIVAVIVVIALIEVVLALILKWIFKGKHLIPILFVTPAVLGVLVLILYPVLFEIYLAFHDLKLTTIYKWTHTGVLDFVGFRHFVTVFTSSPLFNVSFFELLLRTFFWTVSNVFFHVAGGFALALLLNYRPRGVEKALPLRGLYRTLLIVPWAMPQVVAVLAMRGEFHAQYGFINVALMKFGIEPIQWLSVHPLLSCTLINIWLGIPFMMVVILGGLQSISRSYYDAAEIDGASALQRFRLITLPLIRPVLMPAVTLGTVWTFNNINVIYLVTGQAGGTDEADILVSALYKAAFTYYRYSFSAAFALVIFVILLLLSFIMLRVSRASESAYE